MSQSFITYYNHIDYVEVDDRTLSLFENGQLLMILPKIVLPIMISNFHNILLDIEDQNESGRIYHSDENTIIYTKNVLESEESPDEGYVKVVCILQAPNEIVLTKKEFQAMLINAAITCRINKDFSRRCISGIPDYELTANKRIIFPNSKICTILDESTQAQFDMSINVLATLVMSTNDILNDLRSGDKMNECIYWSDDDCEIMSQYVKNFRALHFSLTKERQVEKIFIREETFEKMIYITMGSPTHKKDVEYRFHRIRELFWESIPLKTVKGVHFSPDKTIFRVAYQCPEDVLTLPIEALKAAQRFKVQILVDLENKKFQPTYAIDYIRQYWANDDYAIRTGVFHNLYREIDCYVVKFTRLKDNFHQYMLEKDVFLWLMDQLVLNDVTL